MKKISFQEYKEDLLLLGILKEEIYDFTGDRIESFYEFILQGYCMIKLLIIISVSQKV